MYIFFLSFLLLNSTLQGADPLKSLDYDIWGKPLPPPLVREDLLPVEATPPTSPGSPEKKEVEEKAPSLPMATAILSAAKHSRSRSNNFKAEKSKVRRISYRTPKNPLRKSKINADKQKGEYYCKENDTCTFVADIYKNLAIHCTNIHKNKKIGSPQKCNICNRKVSYFSLHPGYCVEIDQTTKARDKAQSAKRRAKKKESVVET